MNSRHLVDPQLLKLLETVSPAIDINAEMLPLLRGSPARFEVNARDIERTDMTVQLVPGPAGAPAVSVNIYRPKGVAGLLPCIFHIHGGGYVMGAAAGMEAAHRPMAADLNCCIVSVDYRLAPETVFPGAIEDCYAALSWVFAEAVQLKIDTARIGVMGESAGGGLAAALALLVRDRGAMKLAFQHLIFPMIDDRTCVHADPHPFVGEFVWTPQRNHFGWASLLGVEPGSAGVSPYAAAARAENLAGLAPAYLATGSLDLFLEEDLEYARRLWRAGVPTELHVYPGGFHGFQWDPLADITRTAKRDSYAALAKAMA